MLLPSGQLGKHRYYMATPHKAPYGTKASVREKRAARAIKEADDADTPQKIIGWVSCFIPLSW